MRTAYLSLVFALNSSYVLAGNVDSILPLISPITTPISVGVGPAWDGLYTGGLVSVDTSDHTYFASGAFDSGAFDLDGSTSGAFVGYNFQRGELIYGAEAAYARAQVNSSDAAVIDSEYSSFFDLKARAGYAVGDALVYGVVGGSFGVWEDRAGPPETVSTTGVNYGLGVDYQITDQFFLGAEYLVRDLDGDFDAPSDVSIETFNQSAQFRVGLRF